MQVGAEALLAIAGMALVTYLTRIGGLLLYNRGPIGARAEAVLRHVPGAVLTAIVAPVVLGGGWAELLAGLATVLVAWRTRSLLLAMLVGVGVVYMLRQFG
jgi:uncharacterized membrane protein